jgi:hypothetical protein
MRITRESLLRIVQDTVTQRSRSDRSLLAIYLCGSLLSDDFLLGGTADLDLVMVHIDQSSVKREIVPLTNEVHLDIAHHFQRDYRQTRQLRIHPWLGPTIKNCRILYDPQHFLDFTQASVRGQFDRADYVLERARGQYTVAREVWMSFHLNPVINQPDHVLAYLKALANAVNAIASLSGFPLPERRFLAVFPERCEEIGRPGLYPGLMGLLGAHRIDHGLLTDWLHAWEEVYPRLPASDVAARIHPGRKMYYQKAIETFLDSSRPMSALWPLIYTWTIAIKRSPESSTERAAWADAMQKLALFGDDCQERVDALDIYLDQVDEVLEEWGQQRGALALQK